MPSATLPLSTYRLQLNASFTFADATRIVDYLAALGISHIYTSSYFVAVPGSLHGYDVVDPTRLNPEIGDDETYAAWVERMRAHGMGHIIDLVPNHMGIAGSANAWWQDVLENGESSKYADVFDIDWQPLKDELEHRVLLPILGDTYGSVLERQDIVLEYADGAFCARYFEHTLPIAPGTYGRILTRVAPALLEEVGESSDPGIEFLSILTAIRNLPGRYGVAPELRVERDREKEVIKRRLAALTSGFPEVLSHILHVVATFNGLRDVPQSFDALDDLFAIQAYRVAYWRVAAEEINYRRFFDINQLAAIRTEDPSVFERTHAFAFELLARGTIDGFRIDHVDGLYDPGRYLARLQARARDLRPDRFTPDRPFYVVVEKILGDSEPLPEWPVAGTTGYDFLITVNGLFVDGRNERAVNTVYEQFARLRDPYREIVYRGKQLILRLSMASELNVLAHQLNTLSERNRHYRDFTLDSLTQAMLEIIACFPVYRTYVSDGDVSERDRGYIERAVSEARRRNPSRPVAVFGFIRDLLLKQAGYFTSGAEREDYLRFIGKFQQVTSPVTAKGIEDTALYIYNRLVSLNEVGGEPDHFGTPPDRVHAWLGERARHWPHGLSTTSTHDTKRSEDVRARINVLSEIPGAWKEATTRWARANRRARSVVDGESYPSRNEEYLFYQILVGSWPLEPMRSDDEPVYVDRIAGYMQKAMREAKVYSNWLNPSLDHEAAMTRFVAEVLASDNAAFREDFLEFQRKVARFGIFNSLAQLVLKLTAPGVPDFYQGTELWDFSLVDPDNRRPVDYARRRDLLARTQEARTRDRRGLLAELMANPADDRTKLFTTTTLLECRRARRAWFERGGYEPLSADGARHEHLFAYCRPGETGALVVAVPRLVATLAPGGDPPLGEHVWGDTRLILERDATSYRHVLTDRPVAVHRDGAVRFLRAAELFAEFPVAVLESEPGP